jgi:hypothetical protein
VATEQNSKTEQEGRDAEREGGSKVPIMVGSSEEEERRVGVVGKERKEWDHRVEYSSTVYARRITYKIRQKAYAKTP